MSTLKNLEFYIKCVVGTVSKQFCKWWDGFDTSLVYQLICLGYQLIPLGYHLWCYLWYHPSFSVLFVSPANTHHITRGAIIMRRYIFDITYWLWLKSRSRTPKITYNFVLVLWNTGTCDFVLSVMSVEKYSQKVFLRANFHILANTCISYRVYWHSLPWWHEYA